jgi:hypothetical protein
MAAFRLAWTNLTVGRKRSEGIYGIMDFWIHIKEYTNVVRTDHVGAKQKGTGEENMRLLLLTRLGLGNSTRKEGSISSE